MRILYVGQSGRHTNSHHRAEALRRLGHDVSQIDVEALVLTSRLAAALHYRTGYGLVQRAVKRLLRDVKGTYDVAWVNGGAALGADAVRVLREKATIVVSFNNDDPPGGRDGHHWDSFRQSVPEYDLCVVVRAVNVKELIEWGARRVKRVQMSYDPIVHNVSSEVPGNPSWVADLVFVGTWMPERGPFLAELLRRGVPVQIYGGLWHKAPEWNVLRRAHCGGPVYGREYARLLRHSKIGLGLLSRGNRDLHTLRSVEIPFIGTLLCAERTSEHEEMYRDGVEAVFWNSPEECADLCANLLHDDGRRRQIAERGSQRVRALSLSNDDVLGSILASACRFS